MPKLITKKYMENKQTATEWIFQQLWETPKDKFEWYAILEKAKQMEKEQLNIARMDGIDLANKGYGKQTNQK